MAQSNVGRQRIVDCWSSNRERASSELGTDARDGQQGSTHTRIDGVFQLVEFKKHQGAVHP